MVTMKGLLTDIPSCHIVNRKLSVATMEEPTAA
jgi:hypothetical protein